VLEEAFKSLFEICKGGGLSAERGAAITISKIIHAAPSSYFNSVFEVIITNILNYLKPENAKNPFEVPLSNKKLILIYYRCWSAY
jgi:hypothetical protein